jgi:signal transduction histidine kinase
MTASPARSVLIVEDEGVFAEDLRDSLAELGYDAFAIASSSDEAMQHVTARCPDIILMDIRIDGERDGIDTAAHLRAHYDVPIVYLTAHADDATIARAKSTDPYGYLVKPVKAGELRSAIELSLHRHELDRKLRERDRMQRQLEVADRMASLGTLTAGLAHEINNPLAVVIANTDYLRGEIEAVRHELHTGAASRGELTARLDEVSQIQTEVCAAGARIGKIVADLREFARPAEPMVNEADVGRAIRWAVRATAHEFRHRARLVHDDAGLPMVRGDEGRLGQVFVNLLRNAAQAIAPGRLTEHEVAIRGRVEGDRVTVEVRDNGPGIHPEHVARIFEPFFTTKPIGEGTGLGLSVCHGIVTSLGGEIQVDSKPGEGATFRISLRALPGKAPPRAARTTQLPPLRGRILVVDDDAMIHRTMKRLLRDHDVVCTDSAGEALALIDRGERFDVILSDLMMPVMTGVEFYRELRTRSPDLVRRLVFVTGGACATAGAEEFLRSVSNITLEKPFNQADFASVIARMLADRS